MGTAVNTRFLLTLLKHLIKHIVIYTLRRLHIELETNSIIRTQDKWRTIRHFSCIDSNCCNILSVRLRLRPNTRIVQIQIYTIILIIKNQALLSGIINYWIYASASQRIQIDRLQLAAPSRITLILILRLKVLNRIIENHVLCASVIRRANTNHICIAAICINILSNMFVQTVVEQRFIIYINLLNKIRQTTCIDMNTIFRLCKRQITMQI